MDGPSQASANQLSDRDVNGRFRSGHWVFEGTSLTGGVVFCVDCQHQRISEGAYGHESDKISGSSPGHTQLLAERKTPDGGGAQMVLHEPMEGAAVFSIGSIWWTRSLLVDDTISRITANVVRRFAQAEGYVSATP